MSRDRMPFIKRNEEARKNQVASTNAAKECLIDPKFAKYRESVTSDLESIFTTILGYKNPDPLTYAFYIQAKVKEYNCLSLLLDRVEQDAGVANEKE